MSPLPVRGRRLKARSVGSEVNRFAVIFLPKTIGAKQSREEWRPQSIRSSKMNWEHAIGRLAATKLLPTCSRAPLQMLNNCLAEQTSGGGGGGQITTPTDQTRNGNGNGNRNLESIVCTSSSHFPNYTQTLVSCCFIAALEKGNFLLAATLISIQ